MRKTANLTVAEVADLTGLTPNTLYWYRHIDAGPPCYRIGKRILYPAAEFEQWLAARRAETLRGAVA